MKARITLLLVFASLGARSQVANITCTTPAALQAMKGLHDPAESAASLVIDDHEEIICALRTAVNADSLRGHLQRIVSFGTRHTYSDTVSGTLGIGAARRWAFDRFQQISAANEDRLIPAYLQFDYANEIGNCGAGAGWKNVLAVLPGSQIAGHKVVLIEAHLDSRCSDNCDPLCDAQGAEDNGSGSALVLELARVLSRYSFDHTLVFMLTTGEEHGLLGAKAMAQFCASQGIAIKGVLNNDVVGGIFCGGTASPPGCTVENEVDSTQVRLFSSAATRGLARMVKLSYAEKLRDHVPVPMQVSVMGVEDRSGRGGDHIPFRQVGFYSIRFTAANEHGDGNPDQPGYDDRQHTSDDILGVDTDGDLEIDSFFVDFNYLQRNAVINGMTATLLALGPDVPSYDVLDEPTGLRVQVNDAAGYSAFRVGVRGVNSQPEFDAVYRTNEASLLVPGLNSPGVYYVSVAGVDDNGITSPFGPEQVRTNDAATAPMPIDELPYRLACEPIGVQELSGALVHAIAILPNPVTGRATIRINASKQRSKKMTVLICDMQGRELASMPVGQGTGPVDLEYQHEFGPGVFLCRLVDDGRTMHAIPFVAAN